MPSRLTALVLPTPRKSVETVSERRFFIGPGLHPRLLVYELACARGRQKWVSRVRAHDLAPALGRADADPVPPPSALLGLPRPIHAGCHEGRDATRALSDLERHAVAAAAAVRAAALAALADDDREAAAVEALWGHRAFDGGA